ncbi:hypothetical protein pSalSNUABM01_101 [Salmonella phage pSal-SNUABM-01]|nr:hypothetical protein pSalSNUABM01_101 [Salmonella phage pSal-SNUABM-01]
MAMAKVKYKVEFFKHPEMVKTRPSTTVEADMVQIDPAHHKFYVSTTNDRGNAAFELVASFPSQIVEAVTKVGK